jgi:riboflavin kinase/FMN adenylyltransferase
MGADAVVFLRFNHVFVCQAPETFAKSVLAERLKVMAVYVGADFCFGKDRTGRVDTLVGLGKELGFLVHPVSLVYMDGERVSTSRIRRLIEEKRWAEARTLIGRPLDGLVRHGSGMKTPARR